MSKSKKTERRNEERAKAIHESCAERITRRVMHESNLGGETPGEVYDATVKAVMAERNPGWGSVRNLERERGRREERYRRIVASGSRSPRAAEFAHRLDMECGVLLWAIDEMRAMLTGGGWKKVRA